MEKMQDSNERTLVHNVNALISLAIQAVLLRRTLGNTITHH